MPCRDDGYPTAYDHVMGKLKLAEASFCAVMRILEDDGQLDSLLARVDYRSAGVKKSELLTYWEDHKEADEARRVKEAASREAASVRAAALRKLTAAEKKALGIK